MPAEITMPQLSDTMTEGTVVKWLKQEGEAVKSGEIIAEIETDKATMETEAFDSGVMAAIMTAEGSKAGVGAVIGVIATGKEDPAQIKQQYAGKTARSAPSASPAANGAHALAAAAGKEGGASAGGGTSVGGGASVGGVALVGGGKAASTATIERAARGEIHEPDSVGHHATREPARAVPSISHDNGANRIFATPLARRIAKEHSLELQGIAGTGPRGRIVQADVQAILDRPSAPRTELSSKAEPAGAAKSFVPARVGSGKTEVIPLTKMRAAIAKNLLQSKQTIPHFYLTIDVDLDAASRLREKLNASLEKEKIRLSIGDFIAKAVAGALLRHPTVNSTFDGTSITRHGDVHLGMAVAIPDGLIVPIMKNVNQMGLKEIRQRSTDLVERARAQKLKQDEMTGGTFTVSNLGTYGIREFSAIINPPQVAILAIASAEKRPVAVNDQIEIRTMLTLTLSADHRVVDGATGAEFLRTLKSLLEEPGMMLV